MPDLVQFLKKLLDDNGEMSPLAINFYSLLCTLVVLRMTSKKPLHPLVTHFGGAGIGVVMVAGENAIFFDSNYR